MRAFELVNSKDGEVYYVSCVSQKTSTYDDKGDECKDERVI